MASQRATTIPTLPITGVVVTTPITGAVITIPTHHITGAVGTITLPTPRITGDDILRRSSLRMR